MALVGRPSSGKSTLVNAVCGQKVSIVSPVPQTTRHQIRGILNAPQGQLVFVDTPGYHLSDKKLNKHLREVVVAALRECELVLHLADVSRKPGAEEQGLLTLLAAEARGRTVTALNKIDVSPSYAALYREVIRREIGEVPLFEISALKAQGIEPLLSKLFELAPVGEVSYPEDYYTDQPPEFRVAEILREKAIHATSAEVPHSLYVDIADIELSEDGQRMWVRGFIYVERESQKGILIGKGGEKIKSIVRQAREELNEIFPYTVDLDIRVKVNKNWRKKDHVIDRIVRL